MGLGFRSFFPEFSSFNPHDYMRSAQDAVNAGAQCGAPC